MVDLITLALVVDSAVATAIGLWQLRLGQAHLFILDLLLAVIGALGAWYRIRV